jgi:transposase
MSDVALTPPQQQRLFWVQLFEETTDAGFVCRRCGIRRPTVRQWVRRYEASGGSAWMDHRRRPRRAPRRTGGAHEEELMLALRRKRRLGIKCRRNELLRLHQLRFSLATIHKVIVRHHQSRPLARRWRRQGPNRDTRPVPGDRVPVDVCQITPGLSHDAAIDDCTRYRVLGLPSRDRHPTATFLERVVEERPVAIQRIQTDRGREFFARRVQQGLRDAAITFRPIRPASPHLNGTVERAHQNGSGRGLCGDQPSRGRSARRRSYVGSTPTTGTDRSHPVPGEHPSTVSANAWTGRR